MKRLPWITAVAVLSGGAPDARAVLVALLYGVGAHGIMTLNDFKAIEGDRRFGVLSLPVRLGPERAARVACVVMAVPQFAVAALLMAWGAPWHGAAIAGSLLVQCACMVRLLRDPRGLAPWYNATGVSLYVFGHDGHRRGVAGDVVTGGAAFGWLGIVRLGLVQTALGAVVVLTTSVLNRLMVVEFALPATLSGILVGLYYAMQMTRPRMGHGSDVGGRRTPSIVWRDGGAVCRCRPRRGGHRHDGWAAAAGACPCGPGLRAGRRGGQRRRHRAAGAACGARRPRAQGSRGVDRLDHDDRGLRADDGDRGHGCSIPTPPAGWWRSPAALPRWPSCWPCWPYSASRGPPRPATGAPRPPSPDFRTAAAQAWAEPEARHFTLFVFLSMLAYSAQDLVLEPFAGSVFGMTVGETTQLAAFQHGGVLVGMVFAAVIGGLAGGRLSALRGWIQAGCVAAAVMLVALAGVGMAPGAVPLRVLYAALGLANGIFAAAAIAAMMQLARRGAAGRDGLRMGMFGAAQAIAFGLGGLAGTVLLDVAPPGRGQHAGRLCDHLPGRRRPVPVRGRHGAAHRPARRHRMDRLHPLTPATHGR